MNDSAIWFWTLMIFASIAWYGFLLFYVGFKGGRELIHLTKEFAQRAEPPSDPARPQPPPDGH